MSRGILILISFLILLAVSSAVSAEEPTVIVTGFEVTPSVMMPGDNAIITFTIKNTARSSTKTTTDELVTTSTEINPVIRSVYLDGGKDIEVLGGNSQFSGELGPEQSIKLSFLIKAPDKKGIFFPVLRVRVLGAESLIYPVPVNVNMPVSSVRMPALIAEQSGAFVVSPGERAAFNLTIRNSGQSTANDIYILISEDNPSIAPDMTGSYYIESLDAGESATLLVSFATDRDVETGIFEIPLSLTYNAVDGTPVAQTGTVSLDIRGEAEMAIASLKTDPVRVNEGESFDLTIRIENTGTGDARETVARIDIPFNGIKESYIGKIKPGNDAPAVFTLDAGEGGDYNYTLYISYIDELGEKSTSFPLVMPVKKGDYTGTILGVIIILAIIAGCLYYLFIFRKTNVQG